MAILSRRTLQRLINENASILSRRQLKDHVRRLEGANLEDALAAEWEVVLLNAFRNVGSVTHEPDLRETTHRFDLHFESPTVRFISDIVAVSDKGLDELNPIRALNDQLIDVVTERGLRGNSFSLSVEGNASLILRDRTRAQLKMPPRNRFDSEIFNERFFTFLEAIRQRPSEKHTHEIINSSTDITISYDPAQTYGSMSHLSYTQLNLRTQNAVYNRLQEKGEKLLAVNTLAPSAVILCDGDCDAFKNHRNFASYHIDDVIRTFLHNYPEISFVLTIFVEQHFGYNGYRKFVPALHFGERFKQADELMLALIKHALSFLPNAERSAANALNFLRSSRRNEGSSFSGGQTVGDGMIKIPARVVLDLLAGRITQEDFFRAQHFAPGDKDGRFPIPNPFADELNQGRLITDVKLESEGDERDDDWLVFKFGGPDPAVSPFRVPPQSVPKK